MIEVIKYVTIAIILLIAELVYFSVANHFNIIDKPNERSSHTKIVLRGGGIIFLIGAWVWSAFFGFHYPWFLAAVTLAAGVSFIDDIHSLPDSVRLIAQFIAMVLMFYQLDMIHSSLWWAVILALIVCVGATNIYNFMDGINGITSGYSMRNHPITGKYSQHTGIDIAAPKNTKITAAASGTVVTVGYNTAYGYRVIVDHGGGVQTLYAHMTSFAVKEGDKVSTGDVLGYVGNTGYATGYHLHFSVLVNGSYVDPNTYLKG